jgi:hypothetical protein
MRIEVNTVPSYRLEVRALFNETWTVLDFYTSLDRVERARADAWRRGLAVRVVRENQGKRTVLL